MTRLGDFVFEDNSNIAPSNCRYVGKSTTVSHAIPNRRFPRIQAMGGGGRTLSVDGYFIASRDVMVRDLITLKDTNEIVPFCKDDDGDLTYTEDDSASWDKKTSATFSDDASTYKVGSKSIKASSIPTTEEIFWNADMALDLTDADKRCLAYYINTDVAEDPTVVLYTGSKGEIGDTPQTGNFFYTADGVHTGSDTAATWDNIVIPVGQQAEDDGVWETFGSPDWTDLYTIGFYWSSQTTTTAYIDGLTFTTGVLITGFNYDDAGGSPNSYKYSLSLTEAYQE